MSCELAFNVWSRTLAALMKGGIILGRWSCTVNLNHAHPNEDLQETTRVDGSAGRDFKLESGEILGIFCRPE